MKSKIQSTTDIDGNQDIRIHINIIDLVKRKFSKMEAEALRAYRKTHKLSDMLWYLSEVFENMESNDRSEKRIEKKLSSKAGR